MKKISTSKSVWQDTTICSATKFQHKLHKSCKLLIACILLISPFSLLAQDIIIKSDKTELKTKVVEITNDAVKYKEWDNQSGPLYNIAKSQVFMITYQNGKREYMSNSVETNTSHKTTIGNTTNNVVSKDPRFIFTPRDKSQPRSITNFADRFGNIGITLNTLGKTTVPNISVIDDFFFMPNIAFTFGVQGSYNSEEVMGYSTTAFSIGMLGGGAYYLNEILKIDKAKGSAYGGLALAYTNTSLSSDMPGFSGTSSGGVNFFLRAGGRYHFAKRLGAFGEIQIGQGNPAFVVGLAIITIKD